MADLIGTVWQSTRKGPARYVRVVDAGPGHALVSPSNTAGQVFMTLGRLGRGAERRRVQLTPKGALRGYKPAENTTTTDRTTP